LCQSLNALRKLANHGDAQAKVSLSEAKAFFKTIPRKFSAPTFRIVRHDEKSVAAQPEKADLFS
jgi:hypothetical protein